MTELSRLTVSLTKHNAHKIARLLKKYEADQILDKLGEVRADEAQARKNLSVLPGNRVPEVWAKAKILGDRAVDSLVFIGIIFSHHELINTMIHASKRAASSGRIDRGVQLDGKAYTNFARIIEQLGFATKSDGASVTFDLQPIFEIPKLGPLVCELLKQKLIAARWDQSTSVAEELVAHDFHRVFDVPQNEFRKWLQQGLSGTPLIDKDEEFFQGAGEDAASGAFVFKPGHRMRSIEPITVRGSAKAKAERLHNRIQNGMYEYLKGKLGASNVGTEMDTGSGTTIDVATRDGGKITFYEIKTGASVRANIRQAIPQLLEYAYWSDNERAEELIIISHLPITSAALRYLNYLRSHFKLPISYQQFDLETCSTVEMVRSSS